MLSVPPLGVVNTHPSLLPRYRGPNPVAWAIRNGDTEIGMTFHWMDPGLDTGAILAQEAIPLDDEHSWEELHAQVRRGGRPAPPGRTRACSGRRPRRPAGRVGSLPTSRSSRPEYVEIDWSRPREEVARQVRAWRFGGRVDGEPGALTELDGERVRVLRVSLQSDEGCEVECSGGSLWIVESEPV